MEKLSLNESLRIYLPGLFLSFVIFIIHFLNFTNIELILIPSIFTAFLLHTIIGNLHSKVFVKMDSQPIWGRANFDEAWKDIISCKLELFKHNRLASLVNSDKGSKLLVDIQKIYFAKRYNQTELNYFRSPKSFGIMFYNLFVVCLCCIPVSVSYIIIENLKTSHNQNYIYQQGIIILALIVMSILFYKSCIRFFNFSLNRELFYWKSIDSEETNEISNIILTLEKLESLSKSQ